MKSIHAADQEIISITEYPTRGWNSDGKHIAVKKFGTDMVYVDDSYRYTVYTAYPDKNALARNVFDTGGQFLASKYVFATKDVKHDKGIYAGPRSKDTHNLCEERWINIVKTA